MNLNFKEEKRANNIYRMLFNLDEKTLDSCNLKPCRKCLNTGLKLIGNKNWDGNTFCDECKGTGFIGTEELNTIDGKLYICRKCNGCGCEFCNNTGFVDWIENIVSR
jgi:DnaJ-class molecular chaperone